MKGEYSARIFLNLHARAREGGKDHERYTAIEGSNNLSVSAKVMNIWGAHFFIATQTVQRYVLFGPVDICVHDA
jgi:hypothetical protein